MSDPMDPEYYDTEVSHDEANKVIEAKRRKVAELEAGNQRSYEEFRQSVAENFGQEMNMDTGDLRREVLIDHLVEWGVISEEQRCDFEIEFHTRVEKRLNEEWGRLREALAEKKKPKLAVVKQPSALLDQHGRPING